MDNEIQHYSPQPLPVVPPGMTVAYTAQGQPVYIPQTQQPSVVVQMPSQPVPAWLRNGLIAAVGLLILCTPATVLLVVAAPAVVAMGQGLAYSGIGVGIGVIGVAAAIKSLRETPRPAKKK
ncbi:hypothetical protein QNO07_27100 [Streptomyces sp. 549]|uniref:hypothetical protein n=1 Tax=Streptomyces sp. 549 TaxID=3049076 RepID=UPI0024C3AC15|nr:hypothetical protein [Streptomyces sp. 549]MDK1477018.1 hypothetical protein [Streptomyces sp. 549]